MFDKMIVSDANTAESGDRSRYFIVSGLVVGALFISALVLSIYAVNIDIGPGEFDLSRMLAPVATAEPDPPREEPVRNDSVRQSDEPTRVSSMLRPDEQPVAVPTEVSVSPNRYMSRPAGTFRIDTFDSVGTAALAGSSTGRSSNPDSTGSYAAIDPAPIRETVPPPPAVAKPKVPPVVSKGVINGTARSLPHPPYPPAAKLMGIEGAVSVQVTIDESGNVISARAVSGHPMLRKVSETAAAAAKFRPTTLSDVPVKVTGVIVYNFKR